MISPSAGTNNAIRRMRLEPSIRSMTPHPVADILCLSSPRVTVGGVVLVSSKKCSSEKKCWDPVMCSVLPLSGMAVLDVEDEGGTRMQVGALVEWFESGIVVVFVSMLVCWMIGELTGWMGSLAVLTGEGDAGGIGDDSIG